MQLEVNFILPALGTGRRLALPVCSQVPEGLEVFGQAQRVLVPVTPAVPVQRFAIKPTLPAK